MPSSRHTDSMRERGTMMSCTVIAPTSNRLTRMERCFFGMKVDDSSTSVRISSGESFGSSAGPDTHEQQQRPREEVDEPSDGIQQPHHWLEQVDEEQRRAFRIGGAD